MEVNAGGLWTFVSKVFRLLTVFRHNLNPSTVSSQNGRQPSPVGHGIGFMPWYPLQAGALAGPGTPLDAIARPHGASPSQIALAWLLRRSPVMLPIPGTRWLAHLEQNVAARDLVLDDEEFAALSALAAPPQ